jgi:hypothetical protein
MSPHLYVLRACLNPSLSLRRGLFSRFFSANQNVLSPHEDVIHAVVLTTYVTCEFVSFRSGVTEMSVILG